jgi:prolipoprotein diacylglyceryltransferase
MHQILFDFGTLELFGLSIPLRVYGYGLMLVLGFLLAIVLAQWRTRRVGENPEIIAVAGIWALVGGIVGARLAYVIENWDSQFADADNLLGEMVNITSGGLIYYGGLALATILVLGYLLFKRVPVRRYIDIVAVSLMVGLAFGRMGCLLNGCCWGGHCRDEMAISTRFPMYSRPLLKLDGRENPFSKGLKGPSPAFAEQLEQSGADEVDSHLLIWLGEDEFVDIPPDQLHGPLHADQLWIFQADDEAIARAFLDAAGKDHKLSRQEWDAALASPEGLLRGSEKWALAELHDRDANELLSAAEFREYLRTRRAMLFGRFDLDGDGVLNQAEQDAANDYLQADEIAIALAAHTDPLLPAQLLGAINALLLAGLLAAFFRLRWREGQVFAMLLILYPITRFLLELIRSDNPHNLARLELTHNQWTSVIMVAAGAALLVWLQRMPPSAGPVWAERLAAAGPESPTAPRPRKSRRRT